MPIPTIEVVPKRESAFAICRWMRRCVSNVAFTVPFRLGNPMETALVSPNTGLNGPRLLLDDLICCYNMLCAIPIY